MDRLLPSSKPERGQPKNVFLAKRNDDLPEGAVFMADHEVIDHHMKTIGNWKKPLEM